MFILSGTSIKLIIFFIKLYFYLLSTSFSSRKPNDASLYFDLVFKAAVPSSNFLLCFLHMSLIVRLRFLHSLAKIHQFIIKKLQKIF